MNHEDFEIVFDRQVEQCSQILAKKSEEYASDSDKLLNFKTSSGLQHITPEKALSGMMAKHTVSIYDMIESEKVYPDEVWAEKITDHINYLILLRALVFDTTSQISHTIMAGNGETITIRSDP